MDSSTTIDDLKSKVIKFRDESGLKKFHELKDLSAAIAIESAELQETILWKSDEEVKKFLSDPKNLEIVKDEMADIGIYLLSLSDVLKIDFSQAVLNKLIKNEKKTAEK